MKGLNIKRIAAIGLGAALVGSALAPVVSAANVVPTGLDELGRDTVITSTGAPAVDVVVGANSAVSDVVWAGNIAARVAQLATKPVTCTAEAGTVDLTVGSGGTTTSGSGYEKKFDMNFSATAAEQALSANNIDMPSLINNTAWKYRDLVQGNTTTYVSERLDSDARLMYQNDQGSNRYAAGELLASFDAVNKLKYTMAISPGYPIYGTTMTDLDSNVNIDYTIPLFGKTYVIDRIESSGDKLVLYDQTNPVTLDKEQSVDVTTSDGKQLKLVLLDVTRIQESANYTASFRLMDGATVVDSKDAIVAGSDLKTVFGDKFESSVYVTYVGASVTSNSAVVSLRLGSSRIEIRHNEAFPYSTEPNVNSKAAWKASIDRTGSTLNSITIYNNWRYNQVSSSTSDLIKNPIKVGESIMFPNDFAKFSFVGLESKLSTTQEIGNGYLKYRDYKGSLIELPFYVENQIVEDSYSKVTINGRTHTFHLYDLDANKSRLEYALGSFDNNTSGTYTAVDFNRGTNSLAAEYPVVSLDLGAYDRIGIQNIDWAFVYSGPTFQDTYLALAQQSFDLYSKGNVNGELYFLGTDTNEDGVVNSPAYIPHTSALGYTDEKEYNVAMFRLNELVAPTGTPAFGDTDFYLNTRTGNVLNVESIKNDLNTTSYSRDSFNGRWTDSIRDGSDYLVEGITEYGTEISSDNSKFTIILPEERRQAIFYLGATDATSVPAGSTPYTGVAAGETVGNVKVTAVNCGGSGASAVEVVPVSNLVKTAKGSGKSIIVGGWVANAAAANLEVSAGKTLESLLVNSGDYVAAVLASGDIVVAGFSGNDTGRAAQDLITALEGLM